MINPFQYGRVVGPDAFCNRREELSALKRAAKNVDRMFIVAERRMGKTSLVNRVLSELPKNEFLPVYIDLWPTEGPATFITTAAKALTEAATSRTDKMLDMSKSLFHNLSPSLTLDQEGNPSLQFGAKRGILEGPGLVEVLEAPARIADQKKRRVVVVFDEIQRILEYKNDTVERTLRSTIQMHQSVTYFFLGSRKHLIQTMFLDSSRPLYKSAGHFPLRSIDTSHWRPFIKERFEGAQKEIEDALIEKLCTYTEGHPSYTQQLAHALWELTLMGRSVTAELLEDAIDLLLDRESYAYATLWESLTRNQQRFLRGLAAEGVHFKPYGADFIELYGLRTPSNAQRAAKSLFDKDVIDRENGSYIITDRFFKLWIQLM